MTAAQIDSIHVPGTPRLCYCERPRAARRVVLLLMGTWNLRAAP